VTRWDSFLARKNTCAKCREDWLGKPMVRYFTTFVTVLMEPSTDAEGNRAFVLTLGTREQHIRREKVNRRHIVGSKLAPLAHTLQATSNICTSAGLCALGFSIHCTLLGEKGLRSLAKLNHDRTCHLAERIEQVDHVLVLYRGMLITAPGAARCPYC